MRKSRLALAVLILAVGWEHTESEANPQPSCNNCWELSEKYSLLNFISLSFSQAAIHTSF